jgi:hypothetical protein
MRLSSTHHYHQQRRFRVFKHKCFKDDEDYQLLVIKPTKYLGVLAHGWIIKGFLRLSSFNYLY